MVTQVEQVEMPGTVATKKNIFIVGLNAFNRTKLEHIRGAENYAYHGVIDPSEVYETEYFPIPDMLRRAEAQIRAFDGQVDAIAGYMDFPVSTMLPLLCERFGTRTPSLESLLKCEHKYWSRLVQREVIRRYIPNFIAFDPFDDEALQKIPFDFPFFVKPIKSSGSRLGFWIKDASDFERARARFKDEIGLISEPFNYVLEHVDLPPAVRDVDGRFCLAEEIIGGRQCTVEGYVHEGEVVPYGIVDSIRYRALISFFRYQYPSKLPYRVRHRMEAVTKRIMKHIGFDNSAFNIEFFWDEARDRIWLLEINTRMSQSHADLFEKVDGVSNHQIPIDLALGRRPDMPRRQGAFPLAAKFFHRVFFKDATVSRVPTRAEIDEIQQRIPGTIVIPQVQEGTRLSSLPEQDSYSYAVAYIYMGAKNQSTLLKNYERVLKRLRFEFTDVDE